MAICYLWKDGLFFCIGQWSWNQSPFSKDNEPWNWAEIAVNQCSSYRNKEPGTGQQKCLWFFFLLSSFLLPAPPMGIVVFQMFYMYYIKNFKKIYIWNLDWCLCYTCFVTEKKSICKEILCCCSHEILGPVSIWIVILPFIFFPLLSCISHSVLMFSPWHLLLEKYNSRGFLIPLFLFPTEKI